jgi:hypothetical protein
MTETKVLPPTYSQLVERRVVLLDDLAQMKVRHEQEVRILRGKLEPVEVAIRVAEAGFDPVQFSLARAILIVEWGLDARGARRQDPEIRPVVEAAIEELRKGGGRLRRAYFGLKQYEGWSAQREDHDYGFGPRHGSIWFKIGMSEQYRRRPEWLEEYERIACVAWLNALKTQPLLLAIAEGRMK